jgi:hypothetical protein
MEKKASRLRGFPRDGDEFHIFNLYLNKELFTKFKAKCVTENTTVRLKLIELVESSLS